MFVFVCEGRRTYKMLYPVAVTFQTLFDITIARRELGTSEMRCPATEYFNPG
jgi:hypothetical protein